MSFSLAWPLSSTQLQFAASRGHDLSAPASRCRLRPGTPQAKRRTRSRRHRSSRTKERAEAVFTSRPAAGSSDYLAFQRQTAVSSTSQVFADQRTSGGGLHIPASSGVERLPRFPATDCSELHFSAWTPLRRILPHRRSYKGCRRHCICIQISFDNLG